jgi:hypothetical protein
MRRSKRTWLAALLAVVMPVTAVLGCAVPAMAQPSPQAATLYVFDLKTFLGTIPTSVAQYDYFKMATALQGLVNRDRPRIYMLYENTSFNNNGSSFQVDRFWLEELSGQGKLLSGYALDDATYPPTADGFYRLLSDFGAFWDGFVLWDHDVPATANVASTAAGVRNLLPVRCYPSDAYSLYNALFTSGRYAMSGIKLDLVGKFTGASGTIWDTGVASTGSPKNDAYLWAKEEFLDTGLTNPLRMAYCTDSWIKPAGASGAEFVSVALPDTMRPGETVTVRVTVQNTSDTPWVEDGDVGVGKYRLGIEGVNGFQITNQKPAGYNDGGSARVYIGGTVAPSQSYAFEFDVVAPVSPGTVTLKMQMVQDGVTWFGQICTETIRVSEDSPGNSGIPPEKPAAGSSLTYPVMFWTTLANADFHIAQKAFFWDLSQDATRAPIDDRGQTPGEDVRTLRKLLMRQSVNSGHSIFTVSGFVPWNFKYTSTSDPGFSTMGDVASEWTMISLLSSYGGQSEADANAGTGDISNCSVFMHVPLNETLRQNNDKGRGDARERIPERHYATIYMGDYDSSTWASSILGMYWAQSKGERGKYPLCWALCTGLSRRIPQLFNYLYENATPNDYFVAGDNGTGYLNPTMFEESLRPAGMPDLLAAWEEHNLRYNKRFDIDVQGFFINGNAETGSASAVPRRVMESIARMTPVGASVQSVSPIMVGDQPTLIHGADGAVTPLINYVDIGGFTDINGGVSTARQLADNMAWQITGGQRNQYFHNFRCILVTPAVINEAIDLLMAKGLDVEIVDPYTLYRLAGQRWVCASPRESPPAKTIFTTEYESNCWNWFLFIVCFGWVWMWFG